MYYYVWLCMTMVDYNWLWLTMYDYVWLCVTMYDFVWEEGRKRERERKILKAFLSFCKLYKQFQLFLHNSNVLKLFNKPQLFYICLTLFSFAFLFFYLCLHPCSTDAYMHKFCACSGDIRQKL